MCQGQRAEVLVPPAVPPASWASVCGGGPPRPVHRAVGGRAGPARRGEGTI